MNLKGKQEIVILEVRRKIYRYILNNPGLHLRELVRRLHIPKTTLYYHLRYLEKQEMLLGKKEGRYARYYVTQTVGNRHKHILGIIRERFPRRIILFLFLYPEHSCLDISKDLEKSPSTISHHLKRLLENDIVERDRIGHHYVYRIHDQQLMYNVFILYEHSLSEDIVLTYLLQWVKYAIPDGIPTAYRKGKRYDIDEIYESLLEIFPHPYHV